MARHGVRPAWLIGLAAALLLGAITVLDLSPAEARMGGFHGGSRGGFAGGGFRSGFHAGFGTGFHGGFTHPSAFRHSNVVNRSFVTNRAFEGTASSTVHSGGNAFFFNLGVGGFFPGYPVAYPYPAYSAYYPYYYSPCGYYDPYGRWINAPCPPYNAPVSAPY